MAVTVAYNAYDSSTSVSPVAVVLNIYNWPDYVPEGMRAALRAGTSTDDHTAYIQAAIMHVCQVAPTL